jgi:pyruvate-formate lyase
MKLIAQLSREYHFANETARKNSLHYAQLFTKNYLKLKHLSASRRETELLKLQFPQMFRDPLPEDLFIGRITYPCLGYCLEGGGLGYYFDFTGAEEAVAISSDPNEAKSWKELSQFWSHNTTAARVRRALPAEVANLLPSDSWTSEPGIAFPLYRIGGTVLDYECLLRLGLDGLENEAREKLHESPDFRDSAISAIESIRSTIDRFSTRDDINHDLKLTLAAVRNHPPKTFREAIQLLWIYAIHAGTWTYGRLDVILGPFLDDDLKTGCIDENQALDMLCSWWSLIHSYANQYSNRIIIGGTGRTNEIVADRFALLAIEATRRMRLNQPQLTLRFYKGQNPELWERALEAIGEGCTFPMIYNDDVNVPAVQKAFDVDREIAAQYIPFGCGEYVLSHYGIYSPNGIINLLRALDIVLRGGHDPQTGQLIIDGIPKTDTITTFDMLFDTYSKVIEKHMLALACLEKTEYDVTASDGSFVLASLLMSDCLQRAKPLLSGGLRYLGGTIETYGNTNTSDSLHVIDQLVYRRQILTLPELIEALDHNFVGHESLLQEIAGVVKYGNDDEEADAMACKLHNHICRTAMECANMTGLHAYLVVIINNWANTILGQHTGASADGRKAGESMANGNNPSPGADNSGVTALLNSLNKLDPEIHAGAVQNMKFSKEWFNPSHEKVSALLSAYFTQGGTQAMVTVVSKDDLKQAIAEPKKWGHLMVRVGGFSIKFVELPLKAQLEVLSRTLY